MPTIKYWKILASIIDTAKEKIPKECSISDTCFTSFATIGNNLFTRHAKNLNHVKRDIKDLMSVIIVLGIDINSGETVFLVEIT